MTLTNEEMLVAIVLGLALIPLFVLPEMLDYVTAMRGTP
jgi:hypothetical protein